MRYRNGWALEAKEKGKRPIENPFFRLVMSQFATDITITTICSYEGLAVLTINSFCLSRDWEEYNATIMEV
jgi:hypothetical protein